MWNKIFVVIILHSSILIHTGQLRITYTGTRESTITSYRVNVLLGGRPSTIAEEERSIKKRTTLVLSVLRSVYCSWHNTYWTKTNPIILYCTQYMLSMWIILACRTSPLQQLTNPTDNKQNCRLWGMENPYDIHSLADFSHRLYRVPVHVINSLHRRWVVCHWPADRGFLVLSPRTSS